MLKIIINAHQMPFWHLKNVIVSWIENVSIHQFVMELLKPANNRMLEKRWIGFILLQRSCWNPGRGRGAAVKMEARNQQNSNTIRSEALIHTTLQTTMSVLTHVSCFVINLKCPAIATLNLNFGQIFQCTAMTRARESSTRKIKWICVELTMPERIVDALYVIDHTTKGRHSSQV